MAVCTITSKSFHRGTGALLNSLAESGYTGTILVGYTDELPSWTSHAHDALTRININIEWAQIDTNILPHYQKVEIISRTIDETPQENIFYIDSDIIVKKAWDFFEDWVKNGIALCSDINFIYMTESHPMRSYWAELLQQTGHTIRPTRGYANSGFIGLRPEQQDFIHVWRDLINAKAKQRGKDNSRPTKEHGFITFDQDLLNAALMATDHPISLVGHEGMSFNNSVGYMAHPVGARKPWNKGFLKDLILYGRPMPLAAREYWKHTQHPIKVATDLEQTLARIEMDVTAALSRLIAR